MQIIDAHQHFWDPSRGDYSWMPQDNKILNRIHVRIRTTSRQKMNEQFCWYLVPEMIIGVPTEIKNHEYRVGMVPSSVRELTIKGHEVFVQSDAGVGIGFTDQDYIDAGASKILVGGTVSLLPAGVTRVDSEFDAGDTIEIISSDGIAIARGSALMSSAQVTQSIGRRSSELEDGFPQVVVHRDALVLLPR